MKTLQNYFETKVAIDWAIGTGKRYVTTLPTPTSGWLVVSPNNSTLREIVAYDVVGTDGTGNFVTLTARGVGGTTEQTHSVNEAVNMNITAQHWADIYNDPVFTGNVTVPTPTDGTDAVTKDYADGLAIAGSPDAGVATKGIGKTSVAPASASNPIFVGDNDPRVPTQGENDALVGTSGTPSSSNKYVTDADTTGTGSILRNSALSSVYSQGTISYTATENITAGDAVSTWFRQSDGGIKVDTTSSKVHTTSATTFSDSYTVTVDSNSNRALVLFVNATRSGGANTQLTVTINGSVVTATRVQGNAGTNPNTYAIHSYVVVNPPTGINSILVEGANSGQNWVCNSVIYSVYNVSQGSVGASNGAGDWSGITSYSVTQPNACGIILSSKITASGSSVGFSTNAQNNTVYRNTTGAGGTITVNTGTSGISLNTGSKTITFPATPTFVASGIILNPATTPTFSAVTKSSAVTPTNAVNGNKYETFIGFAKTTATEGNNIDVQITGMFEGSTGLIPTSTYYVSDTAGAISVTPGTNTKIAGLSTDTTKIIIK